MEVSRAVHWIPPLRFANAYRSDVVLNFVGRNIIEFEDFVVNYEGLMVDICVWDVVVSWDLVSRHSQ